MAVHQFCQSIIDKKKCILFLDSLYNVFHCSYNLKLCSICPGGREAIILLSIGIPNFRRLFPPGILLLLSYFGSNDSYKEKSIYLHEHFLMKKHTYQSNKVFGSYMELTIPQKLHFFYSLLSLLSYLFSNDLICSLLFENCLSFP